jgi:hypothetical protein
MKRLHEAIALVAPIDGVSSEGIVSYKANATQEQMAAGDAVVADWDFVTSDWRSSTARYRSDHLAAAAQAIKDRCAADILDRYPEWKQRNMTARALELATIERGKPSVHPDGSVSWIGARQMTSSEAQELLEVAGAWEWIRQRRAQSDAEEAAVQVAADPSP